jgi:hypothetical protein
MSEQSTMMKDHITIEGRDVSSVESHPLRHQSFQITLTNCRVCVEMAVWLGRRSRYEDLFLRSNSPDFSPTSVQNGPFSGWILVG